MLVRGEDETPLAPEEISPAPLPGAPERPADLPSRAARAAAAITLAGGLLCAAIGVTVMVAWLARATAVLRFGSQNPMTFNTALALAVTGAALVVLAARRPWPWAALVAGVFDTALGLAVLAEYMLGRGLYIDQLIVKAYVSGPSNVPGRPAVNTAVCLTLSRYGAAGVGSVAAPQTARRAGRGRICHRCYRAHSDLRVRHQNARRVRLGTSEHYGLPHRRRPARSRDLPAERCLARVPHAARRLAQVAPHARRRAGSRGGLRRVAGCRWPG